MTAPRKPVEDWNIETGSAMYALAELRRRDDIGLTPEFDAALGAGRLALLKLRPGQKERVTPEMVKNALLGCPKHVQEAMAKDATPEAVVAWMLERAMAAFIDTFNKHRKPVVLDKHKNPTPRSRSRFNG